MNGKNIQDMFGQAKDLSGLKAKTPPRPGQLTELDHDEAIFAELKRVNTIRMRTGNFDNALPVVDVPIPESVDISCPLVGGVKVHASRCPGCPNFRGVFQKGWSSEEFVFWHQKYGIRCERVSELHCGETI